MKFTTFRGHWDHFFKEAERNLGQYTKRVCVVVANSKPTHETSRNVYQEDKDEVEKAAKANGFTCVFRGKQVHFMKVLP